MAETLGLGLVFEKRKFEETKCDDKATRSYKICIYIYIYIYTYIHTYIYN